MRMQHLDFLGWKMSRLEVEIVVCSALLGSDNLGFTPFQCFIKDIYKDKPINART